MRTAFFFSAALLLGALAFATPARADAINVDFNAGASPTYSGMGAAPDTGTVWNGFTVSAPAQTLSNLVNSSGTATTVSVTVTENPLGVGDSPNGLGASGNAAAALLRDYIATNTTPRTVTLNGLTTGTNYSLYLYGVGPSVAGNGGFSRTSFTVDGLTQTTFGPLAITTNLTQSEDYVVFNNLTATNSGLTITYAAPTGESFGVFNGLQLVSTAAVPEPSSWAMMFLGVGALGMVTWKRKRGETQDSSDFAGVEI